MQPPMSPRIFRAHYTIFLKNCQVILKRSFRHGDNPRSFGDKRGEHCKAIGRVVVEVLRREAERGEFCHSAAVIVIWALAITIYFLKSKIKKHLKSGA